MNWVSGTRVGCFKPAENFAIMLSDILLYSQRGVCSETKVFEFAVLTRNNLPTYWQHPFPS